MLRLLCVPMFNSAMTKTLFRDQSLLNVHPLHYEKHVMIVNKSLVIV